MKVNHVETTILNMHPDTTCDYHVTCLARHPDNTHLCDDKSRWRPEWYEYKVDDKNVPVYGGHILFSPKRKPNL